VEVARVAAALRFGPTTTRIGVPVTFAPGTPGVSVVGITVRPPAGGVTIILSASALITLTVGSVGDAWDDGWARPWGPTTTISGYPAMIDGTDASRSSIARITAGTCQITVQVDSGEPVDLNALIGAMRVADCAQRSGWFDAATLPGGDHPHLSLEFPAWFGPTD